MSEGMDGMKMAQSVQNIFDNSDSDFWTIVHTYNELASTLSHKGPGSVRDERLRKAYAAEFRERLKLEKSIWGYALYVEKHGTEEEKQIYLTAPKTAYMACRDRVENNSNETEDVQHTATCRNLNSEALEEIGENISYISEHMEEIFRGRSEVEFNDAEKLKIALLLSDHIKRVIDLQRRIS